MLEKRTMTKSVINASAEIIGKRAAQELQPGDIVNIGVGIPETVSKYARENGMLDKITLMVESGGVGGFANITAKTPTVVFCLTFNTKGLSVEEKNGKVSIKNEGAISKFVDNVKSISFSAKRAKANGQRVIYVTERCVFELADSGLKLIEVYPGIDIEKDILGKLPFEVEVDDLLLE